MPSPFPGMNPYLEQDDVGSDFRVGFLVAINERIIEQVRPKYLALLGRHRFDRELPIADPRPSTRAAAATAMSESGRVFTFSAEACRIAKSDTRVFLCASHS